MGFFFIFYSRYDSVFSVPCLLRICVLSSAFHCFIFLMGAVFMLCHLLLCFTMCLCDILCLEPGVFRKQPFYFIRGRGMDCVHLTPPDPTKWEYTGFVVVVVTINRYIKENISSSYVACLTIKKSYLSFL